MPCRRHVLDALPEHPATPHDVSNFGLVAVNFHRSRPHKVGGRLQIYELCFHVVLSNEMAAPGRHPVKCYISQCQTTSAADIAVLPLNVICHPDPGRRFGATSCSLSS